MTTTSTSALDPLEDQEDQYKALGVDEDSSLQKKSHHQEIKEIANRIKTSVKQLYRPKKKDDENDKRRAKSKKQKATSTSPKAADRNTYQSSAAYSETGPIPLKSQKRQIQNLVDQPQDESDPDDSEASPTSAKAPLPGPPQEAVEEPSSSSDEGDMAQVLGFDGLVDDYDPEDWDMAKSRANVNRLVGSLKAPKRTECMHKLNSWFSSKAKEIQESNEVLNAHETECENDASNFYVGTWSAGKNIDRAIEDKEVRSIKTLNKFYKNLRSHAKEKEKRARFARANKATGKAMAPAKQRGSRKQDEVESDEDSDHHAESDEGNRFLGQMKGVSVDVLRQRLGNKEKEVKDMIADGEACAAEGAETAMVEVTTDLLEVISNQQNDLADLQVSSEMSFKKLQTAKQTLEYLTAQAAKDNENLDPPEVGIQAMIADLEKQIRAERLGLDGQKKGSADGEEEEETRDADEDEDDIQRQVDSLRKLMEVVEDEMQELKDSGEYDIVVKATEDQLKTPEDATQSLNVDREIASSPVPNAEPGSPGAAGSPSSGRRAQQKAAEEQKSKSEEALKLETEIARIEKLVPLAERALASLESYRRAFASADEESNKILFEDVAELHDSGAVTDAGKINPLQSSLNSNDGFAAADTMPSVEERRNELLSNESMVKDEHQRLEKAIEASRKRIREETQKQNEMKVNIEDVREQIKELSKQLGEGVPTSVDVIANEITKVQGENTLLDTKIADLQAQIQEERARAKLEQEMSGALKDGSDDEANAQEEPQPVPEEERKKVPEEEVEETHPDNEPVAEVHQEKTTRAPKEGTVPATQDGTVPAAQDGTVPAAQDSRQQETQQAKQDAARPPPIATTKATASPKAASAASAISLNVDAQSPSSSKVPQGSEAVKSNPDTVQSSTKSPRNAGLEAPAVPEGGITSPAASPTSPRTERPKDAKMEAMKNQQHADMADLLKLQQENVEIQDQIDEIEQKIKALKSAKGKQNVDIQEVLGTKDEKSEEPPPEIIEMRKDLRKKQKALNALRKRWHNEKAEGQAARRAQRLRGDAGTNLMEEQESQQKAEGEQRPGTGQGKNSLHFMNAVSRQSQGVRPFARVGGSVQAQNQQLTGDAAQMQKGPDGAPLLPGQYDGPDHDAAVRIAAVPAHVHYNRVRLSLGGLGTGIG